MDEDSPRAPLMAGSEGRAGELGPSDAVDLPRPSKPAGARPGALVLALTLAAGISGLLFGCESPVRPARSRIARR